MSTSTPGGRLRVRRTGARLLAAALLVIAVSACTGSARGQITVDEASALFDAPLHVNVSGVRPGAQVTVNASTNDAEGRLWQSTASFVAGPDGAVDVASTTPVSGSYTVTSPTGLLWSMSPDDADDYYFVPDAPAFTVKLVLVVAGKAVAETRFDRLTTAAGVTSQPLGLASDGVFGVMYEPADTTSPKPGVLVFGGSEGGLGGSDEAAALASHGYPALAVAYFGEPGLPPTLTNVPLEYFVTALRWLARQPGVDPARMVVDGVSRGSEAALLLGATYPDLVHAVIARVPSSTVFSGLPDVNQPAWTLRGAPVPFAIASYGYPAIPPAAIIPVERIRGPVFLLCGEDDQLWPSCRFTQQITDRLTANTFGFPVTAVVEPGAGHFVGSPVPNRATSSGLVMSPRYGQLNVGGTQPADALGRLDAWPRLLTFLVGQ